MTMIWQKVSVEEGIRLSQLGKWIPNPKFDPNDKNSQEPKEVFVADYIVHARPKGEECYLVQRISRD